MYLTLEQKYDVALDRIFWFFDVKFVLRAGHILLGYYPEQKMLAEVDQRPESVAEHSFSFYSTAFVIKELFSEDYKFLRHVHPEDIAILHDLGERVLLDIPDDGSSSPEEKDRRELDIMRQFLSVFPRSTRRRIMKKFRALQAKKNFDYLMDKFNFVMSLGYLELNGCKGSMDEKARKGKLSDQDRAYMQKTQSNRALDNVYAHFLDITRGIKGRSICIHIMEALYGRLGEEVPEKIKTFY